MRFLSQKLKMTLFIRYFGLMKVPMIFYCKPSVIEISSKSVTLKIPFIRRNRNHLDYIFLIYSKVLVSIITSSPELIKGGTWIFNPLSNVAGL